jgi:SAM-dependent methyltransferase
LDVGGGVGAYALPLARRGYITHLIDPVPLHIKQAHREAGKQPAHPLASARVGDARNLPFEDDSVDLVLLLGPLYHLTEKGDRLLALHEALRALRSDGILLAAGISRFVSTCDGLRRGYLREREFEEIVERDLLDGQHRNRTKRPEWFTTSYFHSPDELAGEVKESGFVLEALLAAEGPAWLLSELDDWLSTDESVEVLLRAIRRIEAEPSLLGVSSHFLAVARKP